MPAIATCPRCRESVSIPPDVELNELVHCPLCLSEYLLGEIVAPELELVSDAAALVETGFLPSSIDMPSDKAGSAASLLEEDKSLDDLLSMAIASNDQAASNDQSAATDADDELSLDLDDEWSISSKQELPSVSTDAVCEAKNEEFSIESIGEGVGSEGEKDDLVVEETAPVTSAEETPAVTESLAAEDYFSLDDALAPTSVFAKQTEGNVEGVAAESDFFAVSGVAESATAVEEPAEQTADDLTIDDDGELTLDEAGELTVDDNDELTLDEQDEEVEEEFHLVNEAVTSVGAKAPKATAQLRKRHSPGVGYIVAKLCGLVFSAFLGCLAAYYAVAWLKGPEFQAQGWPIFEFLPGIKELTKPSGKVVSQASASATTTGQAASQPAFAPPPPAAATPKMLRPQPGTVKYFGPRLPPTVTSDQLAAAMKEADAALSGLKLDDALPAQAYESLSKLAYAFTFANGQETDTILAERLKAATALLGKMTARPGVFENLGRLATERLGAKLDPNSGVLLAGNVQSVAKQGKLFEATIELAGTGKTTNVLSEHEPKVGEKRFTFGVVVREPGSSLVGYSGNAPVIVWTVFSIGVLPKK